MKYTKILKVAYIHSSFKKYSYFVSISKKWDVI